MSQHVAYRDNANLASHAGSIADNLTSFSSYTFHQTFLYNFFLNNLSSCQTILLFIFFALFQMHLILYVFVILTSAISDDREKEENRIKKLL